MNGRPIAHTVRCLAGIVAAYIMATGVADGSVLVNKAFAPTSVNLGVNSNVTITLSNTSTLAAANITSLSDDIATMAGKAMIATPSNIATNCGGVAGVSGTVVALAGGVIPVAADSTHPGTCTVSFTVVGASVGNGINSIAAGALVTDQGNNATAASQTLQVLSSSLTVAGSATTSQLTTATATQTYTITNPTAAAITNTTFPITLSNGGANPIAQFTLASGSTGACAGTVTPATFTSSNANPSVGTATVSGLTIPASSSCTITLTFTDPVAATQVNVNGTLAAAAITDDQGITNSTTVTGKSQFFNGFAGFGKSFTPSTVVAGSTSRMTITIKNTQTTGLTNVAFNDTMPALMTLDAVPAATYTNCGTPTLTGAGTGTLGISTVSVAASTTLGTAIAASTCTIVVTVDAANTASGALVNTIPAGNFSDTQGVPAATNAAATLTISAGALTATKAFSAGTTVRNVPITETLTFNNGSASALTAGTFVDNLPQTPVPMQYYPAFTPTFTNCGASTPTVTVTGGNTIVTGTNLVIPASSSCVVKFQVILTSGGFPQQTDTNAIPAANVTFTDSGSNLIHPTAALSATLATLPAFTIKNFVGPNYGGVANQPVTVQGQIVYSAATAGLVTDTNVAATFVLNAAATPHGLMLPTLPAVPVFVFTGCPTGTAAVANANRESFVVSMPTLSATCTITYNVVNEATIPPPSAAFTSGTDSYTSTENGGTSTTTATATTVTFYTTSLLVNKVFTPNSIASGGTATAKFTIDVSAVPQLASTQANGVMFTDLLPANMAFAAAPNVTLNAGCTQSGQLTATGTPSGTSIAFANISLLAGTDCVATFDVTSNYLGNSTNTIPANGLMSTSGAVNSQPASASLTVVAGVALQKTFLNPSFAIGDINYVRFLVINSSGGVLSSGTLTDNMPASLALASLTAQPAAQGGDPASCGGTASGTIGSSSFQLSGMSVAGAVSASSPGECVQYVQVKASAAAPPGAVVNTIPVGALVIGGQSNLTATSTPPETLSAAPNAAVTQAFSPVSIVQAGVSTLTITIANTSSLAAALTAVGLIDTLPSGVTVAAVPNVSTTCAAGTVTAVAGAGTATLAGGSLAANATCAITLNVTSATANTYTNTIAAGTLTDTQGATNAVSTAVLTVTAAPNVALTKAFLPAAIAPGGTSVLTVTLANTAGGADALSSMAFSDTFPSGLTVAAVPGTATTCPSGAVSAAAGTGTLSLSGATLAAGASCTVSVNVTGATPGALTNTIPIAALTSAQGASNGAAAPATLTIMTIALSKVFAPASIAAGTTSVLTITIPNTAAGAVLLSAMTLTDGLPSNVTVAATPSAATTCGAGTVTAVAGSASVALAGGSVAANATCTISVNVTATVVAPYTNTIPAGALVTAQGISNVAPASSVLTVTYNGVAVAKAFAPANIVAGATSVLTITIPNTAAGAGALSGMALTDTLPAGLTIAATPNAATTCGAGTATATPGGTTLALTGGSVAAAATCTISASVTGSVAAGYTNTIPAAALTTTQGVSNTAPASAGLTVGTNPIALAKAFAPASITSGATSTLTISIPNTGTGAVALSGIALTDTLPAGVTIAATPNAATTCGAGTLTAAAGSASVALTGGTLAANATCTITASVTATTASTYTNTIAANALTTTQGATNASPATANLAVTLNGVALTKAFAPLSVAAGGISTLTIAILNTATGATALANVALSDTFPAGLTVAPAPAAGSTCGGALTATAGAASVSLAGAAIAANATCTISVNVTSAAVGAHVNTIPASALSDTQGVTNAASATATLTITAAPSVTLAKAFVPASIPIAGTSALTLTIANTAAAAPAITNVALTDTFPAGLTVAAVPNASTTCTGATVTGAAGATSVALSGASIAAGATCTVTVSVTSTTPGAATNTVAAGALTSAQGATNAAPASASLTVASAPVAVSKSFAPAAITSGGVSVLTVTLANTAAGAGPLTLVALSDGLPAGMRIAATPNAATTCPNAGVAASAGGTTLGIAGAGIAAGATCTMTVNVTSSTFGSTANTIPAGALSSAQGVTNAVAASAALNVIAAPQVTVSVAYDPATIATRALSTVTITIANTAANAVALSGVALTDAMPAGTVVAAAPNATTTCTGGVLAAAANATSVGLSSATLAANATCTIVVNVTGPNAGTFVNTIPANAVTSAQGASNAVAAQATLTIVAASLRVTKTSNAAGTGVAPGGTVVYTIVVTNTGAVTETHATLADTLTNATFVPGSLTVNGTAAADAIVLQAAPFGSLAPGASATLVYSAAVPAAATPGSSVGNGVTVNGDQPCTGSTCSTTATPVAIVAPVLTVSITIDGQQSETVVAGQIVTYAMTVTNTSSVTATNVDLVDTSPAGATPISGTVTLGGVPDARARAKPAALAASTVAGQVVNVPIGTLAAGANIIVTFRATMSAFGNNRVVNSVSVGANGLPAVVFSNQVVALMVSGTLHITKTASASVVTVGDRVNYVVTVTPPSGISLGATTITDTLPAYEVYAPGTARLANAALEPVVAGHVLTWTFANLTAPITLSYAIAVVAGAQPNSVLTNTVSGIAANGSGGAPSAGSASASVVVTGSTFGSCYPITGRVFSDVHDSGTFQPGDAGLAGVRLYMEDGESVATDEHGRYNFPCVRQGMHALRLDESTLPPGVTAFDDRRLDSERSTRRLIHATLDATIVQDINFALRPAP